jgi:hypothetical protein
MHVWSLSQPFPKASPNCSSDCFVHSEFPSSVYPYEMVVSPYPSVLPSSPTIPAPVRPTSLEHESTMEITSAVPDTHLDETEAPGAAITAEKEKQADGLSEGSPPPTSTSVQFIGINYVPDSTDVTTTSRPPPQQHPVPWESGATSPTSEGHVVIGLSTLQPKPCVVFTLFCLPQKKRKRKREKEKKRKPNISPRHVLFFVMLFLAGLTCRVAAGR